ncbi:hypothetical protein HU200_067596 [Digitaria exilis]|uniref:Uncharacterized protein n=1 Tax=Digitaria exilis TaxID=1010633 RepID=A0A834ZW30_9POAL|nr:hypothetical protein HU200_067596 [Digitaria exilis]
MIEILMIVLGSKEDHSKLESSIAVEKDINIDYAKTNLDISEVNFVKIVSLWNAGETFQKQLVELEGKVQRVIMPAVCHKAPPLESLGIRNLLDIFPQDLCCPFKFMPDEPIECPVTLTNGTDYYVSVWVTSTCLDVLSYIHMEGSKCWWVPSYWENPCHLCMMPPHSTYVITMKIKGQWKLQKDRCKFEVLMIVMRSNEGHRMLESKISSEWNIDYNYVKKEFGLELESGMDSRKSRIKVVNFIRDEGDYVERTVKELGGLVHSITMTTVIDKVSLS